MIPMKKAVIALSCLGILLMGCSSLLNPSIQNSLKEVRTSKFLKNEDKTKGMLGISSEKFVEQNTFSILLPADIFEREKNRNII